MIPTENLKFSQFLDIIFNSRLAPDEIKKETRDYVQVLETNYTEKIREISIALEKQNKRTQFERNKSVTTSCVKSDLENLFVSCIEQVRKDIIKRRLKAEVLARKKNINRDSTIKQLN
jgi:hypothetical protein